MPRLTTKKTRKRVPLLPKLIETTGRGTAEGEEQSPPVLLGAASTSREQRSAARITSSHTLMSPLPPARVNTGGSDVGAHSARSIIPTDERTSAAATTTTSVGLVPLPPLDTARAGTTTVGRNDTFTHPSPRVTGRKTTEREGRLTMGNMHEGSVALWPSKMSGNNKPELLLQLELRLREGHRILEGATNASIGAITTAIASGEDASGGLMKPKRRSLTTSSGDPTTITDMRTGTRGVANRSSQDVGCTPDQLANLRLVILLDVVGHLKKAFKVYQPVFQGMTELVEGVCTDVATLQTKYAAVTSEFASLSDQLSTQFSKAAKDQANMLRHLDLKQQKIDLLDKHNVQEPAVFERLMKQQRGTIDELRQQIKFLETRDNDLSAALVTRAMTIDSLELKVFELARERDGLLKEVDHHIDDKKRRSMEAEQLQYQYEEEVKEAELNSRHAQAAMANLKATLEGEINRMKQQQEQVKTRNQSKFFLGDYDWTELCLSDDSGEQMYLHDSDTGEQLRHISELKLNERIALVVNLWKQSQGQLIKIEDKIAEGGLVLQGSTAAGADSERGTNAEAEVSSRVEKLFVNQGPISGLVGGTAISVSSPTTTVATAPSSAGGADNTVVPPFLCWKLPGPVVGYAMSEGEVVGLLSGFFDVHKKLVRSGAFTTMLDCLNQWVQSKFLHSYNKRVAFAYSFLHAVETNHNTRNLEVHQFIALLHQDCPPTALMKRAEVILQLRAEMESRQARKKSIVTALVAPTSATLPPSLSSVSASPTKKKGASHVTGGIPVVATRAILKKVLPWYVESDLVALLEEGIRSQPLSKQSVMDVNLLFQPHSPFLRKLSRQYLYKCIADAKLLRDAVMAICPTHLNVVGGPVGVKHSVYDGSRGQALDPQLMQVGHRRKSHVVPTPVSVPNPSNHTRGGKRGGVPPPAPPSTTIPELPMIAPSAVPHVRAGDVVEAWQKADPSADPEHLRSFLMQDVLHWEEKENIDPDQPLASSTHSGAGSPFSDPGLLRDTQSSSPRNQQHPESKDTKASLDGSMTNPVIEVSGEPVASTRIFPADAMIDRTHLMQQLRLAFFFTTTKAPIPEYILPLSSVMDIIETPNPTDLAGALDFSPPVTSPTSSSSHHRPSQTHNLNAGNGLLPGRRATATPQSLQSPPQRR